MDNIQLGIPSDRWCQKLKPFVWKALHEMHRLKSTGVPEALKYPVNLYNVVLPWLVLDEFKNEEINRMKEVLLQAEFPGEEFVKELINILNEDDHLKKCLVSPQLLARTLDNFDHPSVQWEGDRIEEETFDTFADFFLERLYEQPFRAFTFSHVFNFEAEIDELDFDGLVIRRVPSHEIPFLFNETTSQSYLHPYASGEFFIVQQTDVVIENDIQWVADAHLEADSLVRLFQYYKDGVTHVNYSTIYFQPSWLNGIRKPGNLFFGNNRRIAYSEGNKFFKVTRAELEELRNWWTLYQQPDVAEKLGEKRNNFGKVLEFAGMYFESSQTHVEFDRRLIDLCIALESIFSPENKMEIAFQLSQCAAEFVGNDPKEKREIFEFVKKMYGKRSKVLHGDPKADGDNFIELGDLDRFSSIIRRALLKVVALYLNGEPNKDSFLEKLRNGLFDPGIKFEWQKRADLDEFVRIRSHLSS